jgi:hypothetical protein
LCGHWETSGARRLGRGGPSGTRGASQFAHRSTTASRMPQGTRATPPSRHQPPGSISQELQAVTLAGHVRCAGTHSQLSAPCATGTHLRVGVQQVRCARCHSVSLFLVAVLSGATGSCCATHRLDRCRTILRPAANSARACVHISGFLGDKKSNVVNNFVKKLACV